MSRFIAWLEATNAKDSRLRATLKRSLAFAPGTFAGAFPFVEPFVSEEPLGWRRDAHYLAAGLWAAHWQEGPHGQPLPLGKACAQHQAASKSTSTERRFMALLDSDPDQLAHRLRQMVALLKGYPLDFDGLLKGILYWNDDQRRTQTQWARDFYSSLEHHAPDSPTTPTEETRP
jgi:CRISPR system Cascade subunit CasB